MRPICRPQGSLSIVCNTCGLHHNPLSLFYSNSQNQSKSRCFSCFPDLNCLKSRPMTIFAQRVPSLRFDPGFITIENSIENQFLVDDEDRDFITIEKGTNHPRPRRPPSDDLANTDEESGGIEDEKSCLLIELKEEFDVDRVEDEFLRMLEDKCWKSKGVEAWGEEGEGNSKSSMDLDLDLDLESLVKEAEMELTKAAQVWKSIVVATLLKKEEFEELKKRWTSNENSSSGCSAVYGFGSPI